MLRVPLDVRLQTAMTDRHVTRDLRSIRFRSAVPGGFASCQLTLDRPLKIDPDEIRQYGTLYVYDGRSGEIVWNGRLEDPGRGADANGQIWSVTAVGPAAHTRDRTVPLIYVDRQLSAFRRVDNVSPDGIAAIEADPGGGVDAPQALVLRFPHGLTVATGDRVVMRYEQIYEAGQKLARYDFTWDAGVTWTDGLLESVTRPDPSSGGDVPRAHNFNTAGGGLLPKVVVTDFANGRTTLEVRISYTAGGGTLSGEDYHWASLRDLVVLAMRYNADGTEKTTGYTTNTVLASEVVADLIGRLLNQYDPTSAITATTFAITQLAYPDGVTPERVLSDLMLLEPDYYWAAWEKTTNDLYRFEWRDWPTSARYEVSARDGFDSPGSAAELYDRVRVRYRDADDRIKTISRTQTVPELVDADLIREGFIDLGDEVGSSFNAIQAGDEFLAEHAITPNAGTLTLRHRVFDTYKARWVDPFLVRPGDLIRIREITPRAGAFNPGRDGTAVFRIISNDYDPDSGARLELDSPSRLIRNLFAGLTATTARRR